MEDILTLQLSNVIFRKIAILSSKIRSKLTNELVHQGYDITAEMYTVLRCLWEKDGVTQQNLSEVTLKEKANLTKILHNIEKRALIIREKSPNDKRYNKIYLTQKGKDLQLPILNIAKNTLLDWEKVIDPKDLVIAKAVLDRLIQEF